MNIKKNIKRVLLLLLWLVLGSGVVALLIAAVGVKNRKTCKGLQISISGVKKFYFLNKLEIIKIIGKGGADKPEGKTIAGFNLHELEALLERNIWVADAELFFDNNLLLHVNIIEKEPVARIFTTDGHSFYIDSSRNRLPLSDKIYVKIPVFTGYPAGKNRLPSLDNLLLENIKVVSIQILTDPFWMAQIAQVAITPDKNFEMIPTVGSHVIQFGNGDSCVSKFRRLFDFYSQVLSKVGFDKYSRISVQYSNQVVGTKKGSVGKIDSVQALKNINKMIEEGRKVYEDSNYFPEVTLLEISRPDSTSQKMYRGHADTPVHKKQVVKVAAKKSGMPLMKEVPPLIAPKKGTGQFQSERQTPKAVMKKEEIE
ncbi:MAG: hypothetical protein WKF89_05760 [Chitinophagaceae bacterium]